MSRLAPAVTLQGNSDRAWVWLCRGLGVLTVLGTGAWWWQQWRQGSAQAIYLLGVPVACLLCAGATWALAQNRHWELRWDGQYWHWQDASDAANQCQVQVAIDLQHWLLLRIKQERAASHTRWLALSSSSHRSTWHALRCALYCARPNRPPQPATGATNGPS